MYSRAPVTYICNFWTPPPPPSDQSWLRPCTLYYIILFYERAQPVCRLRQKWRILYYSNQLRRVMTNGNSWLFIMKTCTRWMRPPEQQMAVSCQARREWNSIVSCRMAFLSRLLAHPITTGAFKAQRCLEFFWWRSHPGTRCRPNHGQLKHAIQFPCSFLSSRQVALDK